MRIVVMGAGGVGGNFRGGMVDKLLALIDTLPADMRSSMLHDLESGNRLEAPWLAADAGLEAPVHATMYAALKPYVEGRR